MEQLNADSLKCEILNENKKEFNLTFKIIVVGDSGVGKTCLVLSAIKHKFNSDYTSTIGFDHYSLRIKINDIIIKFQIWDTCGQEKFSPIISGFYRKSAIVILVYSVTE